MRRPDVDSGQLREEMRELVRRAAEPARAGESVKAAISRSARFLGLTYGRCKRYWYGEIEVPPAHEVDSARGRVEARATPKLTVVPTDLALRPRLPIHVIYDENGRVWPAGSHEFRDLLGASAATDFDMASFAVRNLGWIEIRHEPGRVHVRLVPRMAQMKALDSLYDLLTSLPTLAVVLHIRNDQAWDEEACASGLEAAERISALVSKVELLGTQRFVALRRPLSVLFRDKHSNLVDILYRTRELEQGNDLGAIVRFAEADPSGKTGFAVGVSGQGHGKRTGWSTGHIGRNIVCYTEEERRSLVGTDIRKGPDRDYGGWCQLAYDRAEAAGEPVVEDVRALILQRRAPPMELCYRRLLFPFKNAAGKIFVLCTSDPTQLQAA